MTSYTEYYKHESPIPFVDQVEGTLSIAAIVPAFNESRGIVRVLSVLLQVDCLSEIIIVDDGSDDNTLEVACEAVKSNPRVRIIHHETNRGKGQAIFSGWRASNSACLLFIDADLINLTCHHVLDLIAPVRENRAQMTYGLFRGGQWDTDFSHIIAPWLTGQRCLRRELLNDIPEAAARGYGFETALTLAAQRHKWVSLRVSMEGVTHLVKENHRGFWKGLQNRASMYSDIYRAWHLSKGRSSKN